MTRLASFNRLQFALAAFVCRALVACSEPREDDGPTRLERHFQDSGENFALSFDGLDDYATTGNAQFPQGRSEQSLSARFMVDSLTRRAALLTLRKDFDSGIELSLRNGLVGVWRVFSGRPLVVAKSPIATGEWHHAAFTFDKTTNALYVDGVLVATSSTVPENRTPTTCWLGTLDGTHDLFQGLLDEVHVWNVVRTPAQIAAEAAGSFSTSVASGDARSTSDARPTNDAGAISNAGAASDASVTAAPGLVLDLPFDESGGSVVFDHSPRQNDGQLGDGVPLRMPKRVAIPALRPR